MNRTRLRCATRLVAGIIALHAVLLAWSAMRQAPTLNEPGHLVSGIDYLQTARVNLYRVNPPLVRSLAAGTVLAVAGDEVRDSMPAIRVQRGEYVSGALFVREHGRATLRLLRIARWGCLPLSICGALVCFLWSRELYGTHAGVVSATLWCFDPNVLGHGALITPDVGAAALGIAAAYAFWRWLRCGGWARTTIAGLALGFAELAKFIWLPLLLLWPALYLCHRRSRPYPGQAPPRSILQLMVILLLSLYVVNCAYFAKGSLSRLGDFHFVSDCLGPDNDGGRNRFTETWIGHLPVPLPYDFVMGVDEQIRDIESYAEPCYLFGTWRHSGWWHYYLSALLIKLPVGTLVLLAITLAHRMLERRTCASDLTVIAPPIMLLLLLSAHTSFNHHSRYALPVLGFLFVYCGQVGATCGSVYAMRFWRAPVIMCVVSASISSLAVFPHTLAYFNECVGGPRKGWQCLLHSNLDWGQGLLAAQEWIRINAPSQQVTLSYQGFYEPADIGLLYAPPQLVINGATGGLELPAGLHVVSINMLHGQKHPPGDGHGGHQYYDDRYYEELRRMEPLRIFGYCMCLFRVEDGASDVGGGQAADMPQAQLAPPRAGAGAALRPASDSAAPLVSLSHLPARPSGGRAPGQVPGPNPAAHPAHPENLWFPASAVH